MESCFEEKEEKRPGEMEEKRPGEMEEKRPGEMEKKRSPHETPCHTLVKNAYQGTCQLCKTDVETEDVLLELCSCLHVLCKNCLQCAIESQKDLIQVACPVSDVETKCPGFLADFEAKMCVSSEGYLKYLEKSIEIAKNSFENVVSCKSGKCDFWCEIDQGRKTFACPKCTEINCIQCQTIHVGVDCQTYKMSVEQGDLSKLEKMLDKGRKSGWDKFIKSSKQVTGRENGNGSPCSLDAILESMERLSLITNFFTFQCPICFDEDVPIGNGVILHECLHMFCKECLSHLVELCEEATVKCPYREDDYSCACDLQPREIKALVSDEVHEKRLSRLAQLGESGIVNSFHCKTPDCPEWCEYEEGAISFKCSTCQNCQIAVQKTQGCDWLQCTPCRTEICWVTKGPRWGPNGRGDTSGGCRCGVITKCHPNCGNCH